MTSTVEGGLIIGPVWKRKRGTAAFFQGSRQASRNPVELTAHWNCSIIQRACSGVASSWRRQDDVSLAFLFLAFDCYSIYYYYHHHSLPSVAAIFVQSMQSRMVFLYK